MGRGDAPPVEDLTVGRVTLPTENEFVVHVQNGGPNPVTLEQVVVNDALWDFRVEPGNRIPPRLRGSSFPTRGSRARRTRSC